MWVPGFGEASESEIDEAEAFFADLAGGFEAPVGEQVPPLRLRPVPDVLQTVPVFTVGNIVRTEAQVRSAVVAAANAERASWGSGGRRQLESEAAMFGFLVQYRLAVIPGVRPDTLSTLLQNAAGPIAYGALATGAGAGAATAAELRRVRQLLTNGAPGLGTPGNLNRLIEQALRGAVLSRIDQLPAGPWSAVWVSRVVRGAAMSLNLERYDHARHLGRDLLLRATARHAEYAREAYDRTVARRRDTYLAFDPAGRNPQPGDIIVQDRAPTDPARALTFSGLARLQRRNLHGDIVVQVSRTDAVTVGGNVSNSVRQRRFPLDGAGRLVRDIDRAYSQETDAGVLPAVPAAGRPAASARAARHLHDLQCTRRVFALLSPVGTEVARLGQPYRGGILT